MGKKPMKAEYLQRIYEVKCMLIRGHVRKEIIEHAVKWDIGPGAVDLLIAAANDEIEDLNEKDFEKNRNKVLNALWRCYHEAAYPKDKISALKVIGEFTGLHEIVVRQQAERIDAAISDEELEAAIEAMH